MTKEYILLNTITNALHAKEILEKNGFKVNLSRLPREAAGNGCGYCIHVNRDIEKAIGVLKNAGVKVYGIHSVGDKNF
jgi:hypothetical protein